MANSPLKERVTIPFMKKVGQVLQEERIRQRRQLAEIAEKTKVRLEFLEAIEANDFRSLPPSAFVRGFLQNYARLLKLDEKTVLALFRRDFKEGERGKIIPREYLKTLHRRRTFFTPRLVTGSIATVIILTIIAFAGMQWYRLRQPPYLQVTTPQENQAVSSIVVVQGKAQIDAVVTVNDEPIALQANGEFEKELELNTPGEQTITIVAEDRNQRATTVRRKVKVE